MNHRHLLEFFQTKTGDFTILLKNLVSRPSHSGEREDLNRFADFLEELFSPFEPRIKRISTGSGDILQMTMFPAHQEFLVLLAHMDTVKAGDQPAQVHVEGDFLYGNGCYDMKNGIALFYYTLKAIEDLRLPLNKKIKLIFTPDEERGSRDSMPVLLRECRNARAVLLPEPSCPDGGIKLHRKGVVFMDIRFSGKASHSGIEPERGKDANRALADFIFRTEKILKKIPGLTFNPGIISGGHQVNQVSGESRLQAEIRGFSNARLDQVMKELKKIKTINGAAVQSEIQLVHPALEKTPGNRNLYHLAKKTAASLGFELPCCQSGGSSDGSNLADAGIPVLDGMGMKGSGAHSPGEVVELSDFPFRAALMTSLCQEI